MRRGGGGGEDDDDDDGREEVRDLKILGTKAVPPVEMIKFRQNQEKEVPV